MFCNKCGTRIEDGAKFCGKCGTKVSVLENTIIDNQQNVNEVLENKDNQPNYVLKFKEAVLKKSKEKSPYTLFVTIIVVIIIVGSLLFQENLFKELSLTARVLLISLVISVLSYNGKKENIPSNIEIRFYDEYFVIFRPKCYHYVKDEYRQEYETFKYKDVEKCVFDSQLKRLKFYGRLHSVWFLYDKNGILVTTPDYDKVTESTVECISTAFEQNINFAYEIEAHSPMKVEIKN